MPAPEREAIQLPWARWLAVPFGITAGAVAGTFWPERHIPDAAFLLVLSAALGYGALALLFNTAKLDVRDGWIVVTHGPLPWPGRRVHVDDIEAIDVSARWAEKGPRASAHLTVSWVLVAIQKGGVESALTRPWVAGHRYHLLHGAATMLAERAGVPYRGRHK